MPDITSAERTAWRRRAHILLGKLLELEAAQGLPSSVAWTVQTAGASLVGSVLSGQDARRGHYEAWKAALTAMTGPPDQDTEHPFASGQIALTAAWERVPVTQGKDGIYPSVHVALVASIWPDEEGEAGE